uniref:Uncharacterized protein n=1 Tax=Bombyx mori TaxID=7091 RepID=A0A8R2C6D5_BOMMO|nr:uncharacterized protein LOC101743782 isoform X1 [Bombyx mori]
MSGPVGVEEYNAVLVWIYICWIYTALLAVTALCIVCILRKRRSSILKSQRPPRTPFSELEFNVATPTDTTKSRRVSFSRRTGVAEFVRNEATTTWENFYEQQNKSLESSGNEFELNPPRQSIGHIGKRIFDQQFEEVEAVGFTGAINNPSGIYVDQSLNGNFTQQIASLECTSDDRNLKVPVSNFELSAFTDHNSKLFKDEVSVPTMGIMSGRIDVNFSMVQPLREDDDLSEIEKDLARVQSNALCQGPFDSRSVSEYIEIDLNTTRAVGKVQSNETTRDNLQKPKVQKAMQSERKITVDNDWLVDKENIVVNPYVMPQILQEPTNLAVNEESEGVLVFDGKRLTLQSDRAECAYTQTKPPNMPTEGMSQRKSKLLNVNDALPNFTDDIQISNLNRTKDKDKFAIKSSEIEKRSILCNDESGNMSVTEAIPDNIIYAHEIDKESILRRFDDEVIYCDEPSAQKLPSLVTLDNNQEKRKTIHFDADIGNMSVTQALPTALIERTISEKRKTIIFEEPTSDSFNMSITRAAPGIILAAEETAMCDAGTGNSVPTEAIKNNVIVIEKKPVKLCTGDISKNRIVSSAIDEDGKNKSFIVSEENDFGSACNDFGNSEKRKTVMKQDDDLGKRKTILSEDGGEIVTNDSFSMSITKATRGKIFNPDRRTVVFDDSWNLSVTQAISNNVIITQERPDKAACTEDISITEVVPSTIVSEIMNRNRSKPNESTSPVGCLRKDVENNDRSLKYEDAKTIDDSFNMSITQAARGTIVHAKRKTIVFDDESRNLSVTQAIPNNIILIQEIPSKNCTENISKTGVALNAIDNEGMNKNGAVVDCENPLEPYDEFENDDKREILIEQDEKAPIRKFTNSLAESTKDEAKATKPIPAMMLALHKDNMDKDSDKSIKVFENFDDILPIVRDVNLYQAVTAGDELQNKIEQGDARSDRVAGQSVDIKYSDDKESFVPKDDLACDLVHKKSTLESESKVLKRTSNRKSEKSILHELLDMSASSTDAVRVTHKIDPKFDEEEEVVIAVDSNLELATKNELENMSTSSLFYITRDNQVIDVEKAETIEEDLIKAKLRQIDEHSPAMERKRLPVKDEDDIDTKLTEVTSDLNKTDNRKSVRTADDTNDLIRILSDYTDSRACNETEVKPAQAVKEKIEINEMRRLSLLPKRQSIALSRENLLSNISMAQAALQQSRYEIDDDSEYLDDETRDTTNEPTISPEKKPTRVSGEVVKTLNFEEDDTFSEVNMKCDQLSPLKKSLLGETTLARDGKAKVIPGYLNDVSDDIKELMDDLVKPAADMIPIAAKDKLPTTSESTCSAQIQVNLTTTSQVDVNDVNVELYSGPMSICNSPKPIIDVSDVANQSISRILKNPIKSFTTVPSEKEIIVQKQRAKDQTVPGKVLLFDHANPLNNVLLMPVADTKAHKYDPIKSEVSLCVSERTNSAQISLHEKDFEVERVSIQYNVEKLIHTVKHSGDACAKVVEETVSNASRPSVNQSTDTIKTAMKTTEANTVIAMKDNKDLLNASSSLTLVDKSSGETCHTESVVTADGKVKPKKRIYSPTGRDKGRPSPDVTPKRVTKLQKMSPIENKTHERSKAKKASPRKQLNDDASECFSVDSVCSSAKTCKSMVNSDDGGKSSEPFDGSSRSSCLRVDLSPELLSDASSKNLVAECESSHNVVTKIEMLPFIGNASECIWETSGSDVWTFLLLYSRVRLTVKLRHTVHNSTRTRVRADTPVEALAVDVIHHDKRNPVAATCVRFAAETMRYFTNRGCGAAGGVPALLRRCCGVARVALKWGRAMQDARARLAYALADDGRLTLKVANVPLRSVWEVSLRMELVVGDAREVPWPRAADVHVRAVLADTCPDLTRVVARLTPDWGHVPRTIWRIFKYLKNKTRDSELLGI